MTDNNKVELNSKDSIKEYELSLIGNSFIKDSKLTGHCIERLFNVKANSNPYSDTEFYELKSRRIGATSNVTMGGLALDNTDMLINQVYNKCKNILMVYYIEQDNSYTIVQVDFMENLNRDIFLTGLENKRYNIEAHHGQYNIRTSESKLKSMYNIVKSYITGNVNCPSAIG